MKQIKEDFDKFKNAELTRLDNLKSKLNDELQNIQHQIYAIEFDARNHIYDSIEDAMVEMEDLLRTEASEACEGSFQMGSPEYTQEFIVDGILYEAIGKFEYNRHDKRYYYVDEQQFEYKEIGPYTE